LKKLKHSQHTCNK